VLTGVEVKMLIVDTVLGNTSDKQWQDRAAAAKVDYLALDQWDAQKNRLRRKTEQGNDIAVSLPRNTFLQNGDVLAFDEASNSMIVAKINLRDVLIIEIKELLKKDQSELVRLCIELGHALGNQHWPAVVRDNKIILPLTVDKKVMTSVMRTHAFPDITYDFHPAEVAIPYLLPHEARRLFGGADQGSVDMSHHVHGAHGGHGAVPPGHHSHDGGLTHHADHGHGHSH
jgi:urease accessory protein